LEQLKDGDQARRLAGKNQILDSHQRRVHKSKKGQGEDMEMDLSALLCSPRNETQYRDQERKTQKKIAPTEHSD
jgi:hypothetical protein